MITLEDIKKHMINYMSNYKSDNADYYDDDGHCGNKLWKLIMKFWENFNTDKDFKYLVSSEWESDDLDLNGGRNYFLISSNVLPLLFDYMTNILKWNKNKFESNICNSSEFTNYLFDMYKDDKEVIKNNGKIFKNDVNIVISEDTKKNLEYFFVPKFIKYPNEMKEILSNIDSLKFVSKSYTNENESIYEIKSLGCKIPLGFEVVLPIEYKF
jgi:hypothetical protein